MNSIYTILGAIFLTVLPLQADETLPPPAPEQPEKDETSARPKVPWLGLAARAVNPVESAHLGLPKGFGLVVEYIFPDSPSAEAGIEHHDVLRKLDDQLLVNSAQLKALVCSKRKGDLVKLTLLRANEEIEVEIELGEHQEPAVAFRMVRPPDGGEPIPVPANDSKDIPLQKIEDLLAGKGFNIQGVHARNLDFDNSTASLTDTSGTYTLTREGKSATLRVSRSGKQLFEAEVTTPAQRNDLPADIRKKLETLESVVGKAKALTEEKR